MRAKEEDRLRARELFQQGLSYNEIKARLNVSKSSLSLWCGDLADIRRKEKEEHKLTLPPKRKRVINAPLAQAPYEGYHIYHYHDETGSGRISLYKSKAEPSIRMTLARYTMSVHLGRILETNEIVRHKEGTSDHIDNLILTSSTDPQLHGKPKPPRDCSHCGHPFVPIKSNQSYCSFLCARRAVGKSRTANHTPKERVCRVCGDSYVHRDGRRLTCGKTECVVKRRRNTIRASGKTQTWMKVCRCCKLPFETESPKAQLCSDLCIIDDRRSARGSKNPRKKGPPIVWRMSKNIARKHGR